MGEALYRRYRPQSLSDVVGQPHITTTLTNAIKDGRLSHAYLLTGPKGVGKTSVARIIAHEVNGFTYADASGALDIIEIDAASNRRIDEIRDLRDKVHIAPVHGKYKVYIIDEVHMLTREAFNALLKTLEEPPAHVIFILATTEAHKLPETIVSRTQRFTFKPVDEAQVVAHLRSMARKEKIKVSDEALKLIAQHGEGSFRDSISLLDQLSLHDEVTEEQVRQALGIPPETVVSDLLGHITAGQVAEVINVLDTANEHGYNAVQIAEALSNNLRAGLINNQLLLGDKTLVVTKDLLNISASQLPSQQLELLLIGLTLEHSSPEVVNAPAPQPKAATRPAKTEPRPAAPKVNDPPKEKAAEAPQAVITTSVSNAQLDELLKDGLWDDVLTVIKKRYNTLYGVARMATPETDEEGLVLGVNFAFHQKRLSEPKNSEIILTTIRDITGSAIPFRVEVKNPKHATKSPPDSAKPDTLQTVNDIFGGGEVIQ